jgi:TonB family protein
MLMKTSALLLILLWLPLLTLQAQEPAVTDTTIYQAVQEMPRFPGCEALDTTLQVKQQCAEANLMNFLYSNIQYPLEARAEGIQGTVVLSFIVETDGTISDLKTVRDIGGGCAEEAMRVVGAMNRVGIRWAPGKQMGNPVRVRFNLPVRFRLEDPKPYVLVGRDTVYVEFEDTLQYAGGSEALLSYIEKGLKYPEEGLATCAVGHMEVKILVYPNGYVKVLDVTDFNNLGDEFQFEAIRLASGTFRKWTPATYDGKRVASAFDMQVFFQPPGNACQAAIQRYERGIRLADEGTTLYNDGSKEEGLTRLNEAVELLPDHANVLYLRGQVFLQENRFTEACQDLMRVRSILSISMLDDLLPVICAQAAQEEGGEKD